MLTRLNPEERKAFLRNWWDGARDRMFAGFVERVSGFGVSQLLDMREDFTEILDAIGMLQWRQDKAAGEREKFRQLLKSTLEEEKKPHEQSKTRDTGRRM